MSDLPRRFGDFLISLGLVTESQVQQALALQPLTGNRVGESLLSLGFLTRAQLQRALAEAVRKGDAVLDRPPLGEILVGLRYAEVQHVERGLAEQQRSGRRLGEVLVEQGVIDHQQLYEALGLQQRMAPASPEASRATPGEPPPAPTSERRRVMLIDDSELACALVQEALAAQGYEVVVFNDPFLALEQVDVVKPDLVLTDLEMPGLDGNEVCRRLKQGPRLALPVIILTADDQEERRVRGLREGADDYVSKGASMEELGARVETVLRRTGETERMRRLFARYTSDAVVDEVLRAGDVVLTGERRIVTVLFADIRHFTAFAEAHPPEEVMRRLNDILGRLADVVLEWNGTLDKFLGDGLMAVWGAPVSHDDDTSSAVGAALRMLDEVRRLNQQPDAAGLELGIGLNTGPVLAGSLGSTRRTEYTCIGDTVNVASRLCALAAPGEVLVGEGTARALEHLGAFQAMAPVRLKGKAQPVPIFRVTPQLDAALTALRRS
ncbi:MAG: adenylate/guanylate cyclase domain-containing protein [Myxococcota bacterium]